MKILEDLGDGWTIEERYPELVLFKVSSTHRLSREPQGCRVPYAQSKKGVFSIGFVNAQIPIQHITSFARVANAHNWETVKHE